MANPPLDHVAIAVQSIAASLPTYELLTGVTGSRVVSLPEQGVHVAFLGADPAIELLEPTGEDSPVHRFLERRGPGLHHIAFRVPDLDAALARLASHGLSPTKPEPQIGAHGHRVAFIHPAGTGGVLIELVEG